LYVYRGRRREAVYELEGRSFLIGRNLDADIHLEDPLASRRHAMILPGAGGALELNDLGSDNGVFVDGERVRSVPLKDGTRVAIGRHVLFYKEAGPASPATAADLRTITDSELGPVAGVKDTGEHTTAHLPQVKLEDIQRRAAAQLQAHLAFDPKLHMEPLLLEGDRYVLGYTDDCDVRLPGRALFVKRAAELLEDKHGTWFAVALHKRAGLKVRGEPATMTALQDGDTFSVGKLTVTFHSRLV